MNNLESSQEIINIFKQQIKNNGVNLNTDGVENPFNYENYFILFNSILWNLYCVYIPSSNNESEDYLSQIPHNYGDICFYSLIKNQNQIELHFFLRTDLNNDDLKSNINFKGSLNIERFNPENNISYYEFFTTSSTELNEKIIFEFGYIIGSKK